MTDSPLKIALLWHHHQPYYKTENSFLLPWVRLHAVKDYVDVALLHAEFPQVKCTYNIVPSLLYQLEEFATGTQDRVQQLTLINPEHLTREQKQEIADTFFRCTKHTMIDPYPRFLELHETFHSTDFDVCAVHSQEWIDLQVWYNLTWVGNVSRKAPHIYALFEQGRDYTIAQRNLLLEYHLFICKQVVEVYRLLLKTGCAKLTVSPEYHPILPLLVDSNVARQSNPHVDLPQVEPQLEFATRQVNQALKAFNSTFNFQTEGMWCSEGSISAATLKMISDLGVKFTFTDEQVLANSRGTALEKLDKYFPWNFTVDGANSITVFFRDHSLSDAIGFEYQHWNANDAAQNFLDKLLAIREELVKTHGVELLSQAVVSVILDGENCWEYYPDNGVHFIRALYRLLSITPNIETVHFQDCLENVTHTMEINDVIAGSWIYGNFNIWIGEQHKNKAWQILGEATQLLNTTKNLSQEVLEKATQHIGIAQGSDWFWWYGFDHSATSQHVFDEIFRYHCSMVYTLLNQPIPPSLTKPIQEFTLHTDSFSTMHKVS